MTTFVLVPGAWAGAWVWEGVAEHLRAAGHSVHALTLSGLDPADSARDVSLSTHVQDVLDVLLQNEIREAVLVGHSYSGLVVGQVAARLPDLVRHTIFVEAFLPVQGKCLLDVAGLDAVAEERQITENGGLWAPPTPEELRHQPGFDEAQVAELSHRFQKQPGRTVTDPVDLALPLENLHGTLISSNHWHSSQNALVTALTREHGWQSHELNRGHWPMLTAPAELADLLLHTQR